MATERVQELANPNPEPSPMGIRHKDCLSAADANLKEPVVVEMPSTSNYSREALGAPKSKFLKIVYGKEEDARFRTWLRKQRPQVLQRAGLASARDLYASHLVEGAKTSARPPMAGSASLNIGAGHFLSQPRKQGAAVPATLAEAARRAGAVPTGSDTARSAASRARRRRRHRNHQLQAVQGMLASSSGGRVRGSGKRAASVISAASGASLGGYSVASSTASRVHGMAHSVSDTLLSYRFGGKGNPKSSTWQAAGFPSSDGVPGSKIPKHDGGLTSLSEGGSWQPEATLKRSQVLQEKVEDELTKQEYYLLGERREVLQQELDRVRTQLAAEMEAQRIAAQRKPPVEKVDPYAANDGPATDGAGAGGGGEGNDSGAQAAQGGGDGVDYEEGGEEEEEEGEGGIKRAGPPQGNAAFVMLPPFVGSKYDPDMTTTAKATSEVPFKAPVTSRMVAGRWRKVGESLAEAEYGYYSPAGEEPFFLKGLNDRSREKERHAMYLSRLLDQQHINLYPLFTKK